MPNEFVARNGLIARSDSQISGSTNITGSLRLTGSFFASDSITGANVTASAGMRTPKIAVTVAAEFADGNEVRFGNADDVKFRYNGTSNWLEIEMEAAATSIKITDNNLADRFVFEKSTGNFISSGSMFASGGFTGSLLGTASYVTASSVYGPFGFNSIISASYALSASYASTASFLLGGAGLKTKSSGSLASNFTGNPKTSAITFTTAFVDNNYSVVVTGEDARTWTIESKTSAGFTINSNSNLALEGTTYWTATAFGES